MTRVWLLGRALVGYARRGLGAFGVNTREPGGTLSWRDSIKRARSPSRKCRVPHREWVQMNCSQVVDNFSDYLDGAASDEHAAAIEGHLESCPECSRYSTVLKRGARLLRSLPEPELREDFVPRLQHRLFHVDNERAVQAHGASGAPALTVLGIAVLLAAIAWSPTFFSGSPVVQLDPIIVDRAPTASVVRPVSATPPGTFSTKSPADLMEGLWANTLLYDYSPLSQRYEQRARVRRASELGR